MQKEGRIVNNSKSKDVGLNTKKASVVMPTAFNKRVSSNIRNNNTYNTFDFKVLPASQDYILGWFLPGKPVPKGRPRLAVDREKLKLAIKSRSLEMAMTAFSVKTPQNTLDYENKVRAISSMAASQISDGPMEQKNIEVEILFFTKKRSRADIDNLIKAILDGMNTIIYNDDRQIDHIISSRYYGENVKHEGVLVKVRSSPEEPFDTVYSEVEQLYAA